MLEINPEKVCFVALKAREYQTKVEPEGLEEGSGAADDRMQIILEDYPDDATYAELLGAMDSLTADELNEVMALAWIGRGDYDVERWEEAIEEAEGMTEGETKRALVQTPLLADYLESGLEKFDRSCAEFELT